MSNFKNFKHCTARYMLIALLLALFMSLTLMSCGSSGDSSDKHVHTYSSAWSRDAKDHWHAATCGHDVVSDKAAHTYGNWTVVTAATATRDGLRRKTCSVCRYAQEEVIPKTGPEASGAEPLNGVFAVNSSGKEVSFSKGNLYYTGSVWKFENNQYDFRTWSGKDAVVNGVYSSTGTPSGNVGLFYWSKNKKIAIAETYNDPGRSADDTFFVNTDSSVAGADWIALSSSEWDYLLNTRSNASSKRGLASINTGSTSVKGLVLLPDSWTLPNGCTFTGADESYGTNSYTKAQWTAMESEGAVFFPASGIRAGSSAEYVQSDGYYGSSTPSADKDYANEMGFYIGLIGTDSYDRIYGGSIRPVMSKSHTHMYSSEWTSDADYHWHASTCGHDVVSDKAAHTYGNWTTITDATTTSTGLICTSCTVCGYVLEEVIPVVIPDHTHTYSSAWSSDTNYHWHASTCGHDVTKDKAAHSWNSGEVTTSATHTASGVKTYTCTVCGKTKTETIPAQTDAHTYATAWTSDADYHWHASTCGHDVTKDKAVHSWNSGTVTISATHTANGVKTYTCAVCGKTKTEAIPAQTDAHTYATAWTSDADYHWHASTCGHDVTKDKALHTYGNWTTITDATTTSTGLCEHTCTVCGYVQTEVIPVVIPDHTHTYASSWSSDTNYHWHASTCGHDVTSDRAAHSWNSGTVTTPATHTANGVKTYTCTVCGKTKTETIPAQTDAHTYATEWTSNADYHWHASTCGHDVTSDRGAHSWNSGTVTTSATHTANGVKTYTCTVCGKTKTETMPAQTDAHTYATVWTSDADYHWHASTCGHDVIKDKAEHSWNSGDVTTSATHTASGVKTYTCTVCGKTKTETIPALTDAHTYATAWTSDADYHWHASTCGHDVTSDRGAHSWNSGTVTTSATHTANGVRTYTCTVCGKTKTETIPALTDAHTYATAWTSDADYHWHASTCGHGVTSDRAAHSWNSGTVTTSATHTANGVRTYTCTVCGKTKTETIPALTDAHTYATAWTSDADYHWHASSCGHGVIKDKAVHSWNSGTVTTSATHTANGVKTYTCTVCGKTKTETIPAQTDAHTYATVWTSDADYHWHASSCGHDVTSDRGAHSYGNWITVTNATIASAGLRRRACTVCGYAQKEVISPLGALSGVFTVNSSGKQVRFSKGNLYYTGSEWNFEENQYDFRTWSGKDAVVNGVYSSTGTPSGNAGLFYWSKDKNIAVAETYNDRGKSTDDTFFVNTDSSVAGADWIALSRDEWYYLVFNRSNASSMNGLATINTGSTDVKGLVVLPDSWVLPSSCTFTCGYENGYETNSYTKAQWSDMEASGAVFLAAAGFRHENYVQSVQSIGTYWTSTPHSSNVNFAPCLLFYESNINVTYTKAGSERCDSSPVRPVTVI